jgi:uncharacterized SAM-binding protein YcdF (DUF218 family)
MKKIILSLVVMGSLSLFVYVLLLIYIGKNVYLDNRKKSDVILVLGAKSYKGDTYNPCLVARVQHAADLYKLGFGKKIIMSGGDDREDNRNEAQTMKQIALGMNVPETAIVLEKKSTSSFENVMFSRSIMHDQDLSSVIIVTEPFHSPRASLVAKKAALNYSVSPTLTSQCWLRWKYGSRFFLREPFAIIGYFLQGKI